RDQRNAGSDLMRVICTQGDFGYFIAGFLLREFGVRVAPTLNDPLVMRFEPSLMGGDPERRQAGAALRKLCEALRLHDLGALCRHLTNPALDEPLIIEDFRTDPRERMQAGALVPERVAFLGHFIDPTFLSRHEPSLSRYTPDQLDVLIRRTWDSVRPCPLVRRDIRSTFGHAVGFHFIGLLVTSEILFELLRRHEIERARNLIRESVIVARDHGCRLVGFGQFTSIVTRNCKELVVPGVGFTSGNALTTGMALQALREVLKRRGKNLKDLHVAVIGAGGNIGSTFARLLADEARVLTLIGGTGQDSRSRIEQTAGTILLDQSRQLRLGLTIGPSGERLRSALPPSRLPQRAEGDPADILREGGIIWRSLQSHFTSSDSLRLGSLDDCRQADVIVTATNATRPILHDDLVGQGAVICDISIPSAVAADVRARSDVTVFQGGVVALPHGEKLNIGGLPLEPGLVYACMAETILLGLERRWDDYSVGDISKEQVLEITTIAERNGFRLGRIKEEVSL
ncbi:MAG TPA: hypothetical protein PKO06_13315, partial [Candidatus Ozemobacteraceae bacterium]|nr:hypothetical protein [Candidatus Ozemobacteraceae bacterium]